ncbi:MAG: efflux RND transporter periplasmic adaptor subunit [bacterium]
MKKSLVILLIAVLLVLSIALIVRFMQNKPAVPSQQAEKQHSVQLYTCGMHPQVIQEGPGNCPICGMKLVPLGASTQDSGAIRIDPATIQNIGLTTVYAQRRDLTRTLRTNGTVKAPENALYRVTAKVSGWIEKLYIARTGDTVRKGSPLLEIYSPELVATQEEYLLALKNANLLERNASEQTLQSAQELRQSARKRLELWDISEEQIRELESSGQVRKTLTLHSPANGVVLMKNAVEGAQVMMNMELYLIANLNPIWVEAQIYEHELPWVHTGAEVMVRSPYDPSISGMGRVDFIYPFLDEMTRTVKARIVLPNPELQFKPDMYADVEIQADKKENVIALPKNTVIRSGERDLVFVAQGDGHFKPQQVKLGLETDTYYEILEGLQAGTQVVSAALFLLDSEASLQEAILRHTQQRQGPTSSPSSEAKPAPPAHQH